MRGDKPSHLHETIIRLSFGNDLRRDCQIAYEGYQLHFLNRFID